jgi:hypothetical protein
MHLRNRSNSFDVGSPGISQPGNPRFVRLFHGTLRVNAAARISRLVAYRTEDFLGTWNDNDWLDDAHFAPNGDMLSSPTLAIRRRLNFIVADEQAFMFIVARIFAEKRKQINAACLENNLNIAQ